MLAGHATWQHGSDFLTSLLLYPYLPATLTFLVALTRRHSCLAHNSTYRQARFTSYQPKNQTLTHKHNQIPIINNNTIMILPTLTTLALTTTFMQPTLGHSDNNIDSTADNDDGTMMLPTPMPTTTTMPPTQQL